MITQFSAFLKKVYTDSAITGPISLIAVKSSIVASASFPSDRKRSANTHAAFSPICLIPSAKMSLFNSLDLLLAIASIRFAALFWAILSRVLISSSARS